MKRLLLALFILVSLGVVSQELSITTSIFKVVYSEHLEQPLEVNYTVDCWDGTYSRKGMDFRKVKHIHTSDAKDYYKNVWDKGHMAPAAAFKCEEEDLRATFSYLNCALQHEGLNRGPWKHLESYERELAKQYGSVDVKIIVHFEKPIKRVPAGAAIPSSFSKLIFKPDGTFIKFTMPNTDLKGRNYLEFKQ